MTFAKFVEAVAKIPDRLSDIHFRSQHTFFYHRKKLMVYFVGHFEQHEQDWNFPQKKFGLPVLPHQNRSIHLDYSEA